MPLQPGRIKVGEIVAARGVGGQVKIKTFTEDPFALGRYGLSDASGNGFSVRPVTARGHTLVASVAGVRDRSAAERLIGTALYVDKTDLPPLPDGQFYFAELIGLDMRLADGTLFGTVEAMHNFGAGDIVEVALSPGGRTEMLPFNARVVEKIDIENRFIIIRLLEEFNNKD